MIRIWNKFLPKSRNIRQININPHTFTIVNSFESSIKTKKEIGGRILDKPQDNRRYFC